MTMKPPTLWFLAADILVTDTNSLVIHANIGGAMTTKALATKALGSKSLFKNDESAIDKIRARVMGSVDKIRGPHAKGAMREVATQRDFMRREEAQSEGGGGFNFQ